MYAATIGMFDGVHRGHQFVVQQLTAEARRHGMQSVVITFDRSPRQEPVLTPTEEKIRLLREAGADRVEVLPFTAALKSMTARQFMEWMHGQLDVHLLLTGYDNRFGHGRTETFTDYVRYGQELGIEVMALTAAPDSPASSSLVRQLLTEGRVAEASTMLGRPYAVSGHVTHGHHIGTGLGFPTANLVPDDRQQLIPATGAYAVLANRHAAMMNIGTRPTFDNGGLTMEVHIFDIDADLYGQPLTVHFIERLRAEQRFNSPEALRLQLEQDAQRAKELTTHQRL